MKPIPFS